VPFGNAVDRDSGDGNSSRAAMIWSRISRRLAQPSSRG
jgi:hypothetical protein